METVTEERGRRLKIKMANRWKKAKKKELELKERKEYSFPIVEDAK